MDREPRQPRRHDRRRPSSGYSVETGADVMVEAAPKVADDKGGIPVWADAQDDGGRVTRRLQVLEEFRLPKGFDAAAVRVFNTNTFLVRAESLLHTQVRWNWFEVEKRSANGPPCSSSGCCRSSTAAMPAAYVRVPRDGVASRFLPVKDHDELARRREDIRAVAAARGMLAG